MNSATSIGIVQVASDCDNVVGLDLWPTLGSVDLSPERRALRSAAAKRKRLDAQLRAARVEERAAIIAALDSGTKQVEVCAETGFTREHVRRLARRDDVEQEP